MDGNTTLLGKPMQSYTILARTSDEARLNDCKQLPLNYLSDYSLANEQLCFPMSETTMTAVSTSLVSSK